MNTVNRSDNPSTALRTPDRAGEPIFVDDYVGHFVVQINPRTGEQTIEVVILKVTYANEGLILAHLVTNYEIQGQFKSHTVTKIPHTHIIYSYPEEWVEHLHPTSGDYKSELFQYVKGLTD